MVGTRDNVPPRRGTWVSIPNGILSWLELDPELDALRMAVSIPNGILSWLEQFDAAPVAEDEEFQSLMGF